MDRAQFLHNLEQYGDTVTRVLLLRCSHPEDAQDCFQSVFLKLLICDKAFQDDEHVKAWLIRTAIHEAASFNRQFWKRNVIFQGDTPFSEDTVPDSSSDFPTSTGIGRTVREETYQMPCGLNALTITITDQTGFNRTEAHFATEYVRYRFFVGSDDLNFVRDFLDQLTLP